MEHRNSGNGIHFGSALVGFAVGVFGTVLYAAYREREFNRVVGKTREIGDRSTEYLGEVSQNVRTKAVAMVDRAQQTVDDLSEKVKSAVSPKDSDKSMPLATDVASSNPLQS